MALDSKEKIWFFKKVYQMLNAGISLRNILLGLIESNAKIKKQITNIITALDKGNNFAESVKTGFSLSRSEELMIRAAQITGDIGSALRSLVDFQAGRSRFKQEAKRTLIRPLISFTISIAVLVLVTTYVVPRLMGVLPAGSAKPLTLIALKQFGGAVPYFGIVVALIVGFILYLYFFAQPVFYRLLYATPFIGTIKRYDVINVFLSTISVLTQGGVPVSEAIGIACEESDPYMKTILDKILKNMYEGRSMRESFLQSGIFPFYVIEMVDSAEQSSDYPKYLKDANLLVEDDFMDQRSALIPMIEMAALVMVAGVIILVFFSIIMTITDMGGLAFK